MSIEEQRARFEAWVAGRKVVTKYGAKIKWQPTGQCYLDYRINDRWIAWRAALDNVCVELPNPWDHLNAQSYEISCRDAIHAAGVKTK